MWLSPNLGRAPQKPPGTREVCKELETFSTGLLSSWQPVVTRFLITCRVLMTHETLCLIPPPRRAPWQVVT